MANRKNTFLLKRSNVVNKSPSLGDIQLGEIALNTADAKLFSTYTGGLTGATEIREIGWDRLSTISGGTVNGTLVVDTLSATTYTGLTLTDLDDVTSNIPTTPDNTYQGRLLYFDVTDNLWVTGEEYVSTGNVTIWAKKGTAGTIDKGCPVYITGFDNDIHEVELANATTASTMPVIGFTGEDFDNAGVYPLITFGKLVGVDTTSTVSTINPNGETWAVNDVLYMNTTDGGLTKFRPAGTNTQIQRVAKVLKVATTSGQLFIFNTARTAGLPNLTSDYLWVGNGLDRPLEVIKTDVGITTTGFTYNNNNTLTITDDNGGSLSTTINQMSGLTINGDLIVRDNTTLSGLTTVYGDTPTSAAIRPGLNNTYDLGQPSFRWREIYTTNLDAATISATTANISGDISVGTLGNTNDILIVGSGKTITSTDVLSINPTSKFVGINQSSPEVTLHMTGEGPQSSQIRMEQYNDTADAPDVRTRRYRGTIASPLAIDPGDYLYRSNHEYWNGSSLIVGGSFAFDNTNNANRTQFAVSVTTDGTSADPATASKVQFKIDGNDSGAITFNNAYKFPTTDGSINQVLQTNGSGVVSWSNAATGITTTGFTYNDNNTFTITDDNGGSLSTTINQVSGLTINGNLGVTGDTSINGRLGVTGTVNIGTLGAGTSINTLGIDSNGFVVSGNTTSSDSISISYFNVQNSSLADRTIYYLGQMTGLQTSVNAVAHIPLPAGTITEAYIGVYNAGTFASGENISVIFASDGGSTTNILSSTVTATSRHQEFIITGLSISINAGRTYVNIETPNFTTNPTSVQFRVGIKLEL
jgi:hypothetical protein